MSKMRAQEQRFWGAHACSVLARASRTRELFSLISTPGAGESESSFPQDAETSTLEADAPQSSLRTTRQTRALVVRLMHRLVLDAIGLLGTARPFSFGALFQGRLA